MTTARKNWAAAALIAAGFVVVYWDVVAKLVLAWYTDDNYSHGFLIVPVALYLAWERRARFQAAEVRPTAFGLVVVASAGASRTALDPVLPPDA